MTDIRKQWLARLAALTRPLADAAHSRASMAAMLERLADYPDRCINDETLDAAARSSDGFWPPYDAVAKVLDAWLRDNRLPAPRIEAPKPAPVAPAWGGTDEMRATLAAVNSLAGTAPHAAMLRALRAAVAQHAPELLPEIDGAMPLGPQPVPSEAPPPTVRALKPEYAERLASEARQRVARVRADEQDEGGSFW